MYSNTYRKAAVFQVTDEWTSQKEDQTMRKEGYYSTGQFSEMAGITKKTLRYYDEKNILKPSFLTDSGARFYNDQDLVRLQQILLLKFLGFSLSDIREMLVKDFESEQLDRFLQIQKKLVEDKIEQLSLVSSTIENAKRSLENGNGVDWSQLLNLIHVTGMENSMRNQYKNANNISARIMLHSLYATNKQGWFPFIYENLQLKSGMRVLEVGCGDGSLWMNQKIPENVSIVLTDKSDGMLRDAMRKLNPKQGVFTTQMCDCEKLPFSDETFDLVIANHVLFYCDSIENACQEIRRVLKKNGRFIAGTYGRNHMKEVNTLMTGFDERIALSQETLYDRFGKENGAQLLAPCFRDSMDRV